MCAGTIVPAHSCIIVLHFVTDGISSFCYYSPSVFCIVNSRMLLVRGKHMTQNGMFEVDELVREIAKALVDDPSAVEVDSVDRDESTVLKLRVAPQDVGKVIGKQGRTARSVRTILGAVSMKLHHRYTLDILEEDDEE
jgi:predicted RNA-binding protein YlqC (UPF0109 family)